MFHDTDSVEEPWTVVKSDCKQRARLNAIRQLLPVLPDEGRDLKVMGAVDPLPVRRAP